MYDTGPRASGVRGPSRSLHLLQIARIDDRVDVGHLVDLLDAQPELRGGPGDVVDRARLGGSAEVRLAGGQVHQLHGGEVGFHTGLVLAGVLLNRRHGGRIARVDLGHGRVIGLDEGRDRGGMGFDEIRAEAEDVDDDVGVGLAGDEHVAVRSLAGPAQTGLPRHGHVHLACAERRSGDAAIRHVLDVDVVDRHVILLQDIRQEELARRADVHGNRLALELFDAGDAIYGYNAVAADRTIDAEDLQHASAARRLPGKGIDRRGDAVEATGFEGGEAGVGVFDHLIGNVETILLEDARIHADDQRAVAGPGAEGDANG